MNNSVSLALGAFLILLLGGNVILFYIFGLPESPSPKFHASLRYHSLSTINDYLNHLSPQYRVKNLKFELFQKQLYKKYNISVNIMNDHQYWPTIDELVDDSIPLQMGYILHKIKTSKIVIADNAQKGTQLKLFLYLEGKTRKRIYFKPKRYNLDSIISGNIYAGYDRHNAEVLGYYLAIVMNYKWVAPSVIRKVNLPKEIMPVATLGLQRTVINKGHGEWCIYGKCYFCRINETVCGDETHPVEGAAILHLDESFRVLKSPWRRSYSSRKMEWEINDLYCDQVKSSMSSTGLLDLIEVAIFDFLVQNGDRHRYEVYRGKVMLLDNGKGLGDPYRDEMDILAPLYQCCMLRLSTWHHLELLSGGALTQTIRTLSQMQGDTLATDQHFVAIERRLLTVYATVQRCVGKYGGGRVFK